MTNEERIERLRKCASFETCHPEMCDLWSKDDCRSILLKDAAAALEAADKRIAELEAQLPKEGEWEERYIEDANPMFRRRFYCSRCGDWTTYGKARYCPNCGAKMKGENDEQIH